MSKLHDLAGVLRGVQNVVQAGLKLQESEFKIIWANSSVRSLLQDYNSQLKTSSTDPNVNLNDIIKETSERLSTVIVGLKEYSNLNRSKFLILFKRD